MAAPTLSISIDMSGATSDISGNSNPPKAAIRKVKDVCTSTNIVKFGYKDVDSMISDAYTFTETNNSTICDIIAMYLKGQKILYTESKTVCEQRLNFLMLPAILITALCTIFSQVFKETNYGSIVVSSLNGVNVFLLALISYLKLDAKAEAHRTAAHKFDKLQSFMEFNSGRILFDAEASNRLVEIIQQVESNVRDIKETNQFILPEKIRYTYPNLYSMNVFSEVKKIQFTEMLYINKIKDYMNEILNIQAAALEKGEDISDENCKRIKSLEAWIKQENTNILLTKHNYLKIDNQFEKEMEKHRNAISQRWQLCGWLKS